jgi:hypothetical protein
VVVEKDEDQFQQPREKLTSITKSQGKKKHPTYNKKKEG